VAMSMGGALRSSRSGTNRTKPTATQVSASANIGFSRLFFARPRDCACGIAFRYMGAEQFVDDVGCDVGGKLSGTGERPVPGGRHVLLGRADLGIEVGIDFGALLVRLGGKLVASLLGDRMGARPRFRQFLLGSCDRELGFGLEPL